ncbi:protein of unknown function DUF558 [Denitrovibrio acetiphilus DSM 12809]|uniref:Ribosomal RNA small subunit methyltransferase E n=1 Tax=Denitrovibrio acetiphilus (strain DSM 12809 / NBRC 114555 / N2460) TaxID=522772 RepID=D4H1L0_DENA2|nr:RsmE family RNA methyltransferase [Denitrovibrio acetiphilus]ADD68770.1 protein of unknown function DUF558 [Denitrovibrio acetiphilus DSM 12809]
MNLLVLNQLEMHGGKAVVTDWRASHIRYVLKSAEGETIKAGILNGEIGKAVIEDISDSGVTVSFQPEKAPPEACDVSLILALPRPKAFRRILFGIVTAGVKDVHVINTWRVEKSYWQSPYLSDENINKYCLEALMQCRDTVMPDIHFYRFFTDFFEEGLPTIPEKRTRFIAHPYGDSGAFVRSPAAVAIGPEGGFIDRELETFIRAGFTPFSLGERILTTEHFVPFVLGSVSN